MKPLYKSSIPRAALERITKRYPDGTKREAEYRLARKLVGVRVFFESGEPQLEYGMKAGKKHGIEYDWIDPGVLVSAEPWADGMQHGTARQWDNHGRLIGTYRMIRGTGIDLWRMPRTNAKPYLSEVLYCKKCQRHGFQWFIDEDQTHVFIERHFHDGALHGIWREWNWKARLRHGFPKYYVNNEKVSKRRYLKAVLSDPALPPFRLEDNLPARTFPREIAKHLRF